ncbi:hemagglutinin protein [Lacinutrix sp. MEBiC02404]
MKFSKKHNKHQVILRKRMSKTSLIFLSCLLCSYISFGQTIEKFSIDSGGAIATAGNIEILYTIGELNTQELSTANIQVSEGFINGILKIKIEPKLFLQGPFLNPATPGLMNDNLRSSNYLPTTSPYADAATCNPSVFSVTGNQAIVDWVWVELRAANDNQKLINGKSALLQRDGDVVALDGLSDLVMYAAPTNYYIVVKHRNHLGAMSATTIGLNENAATLVDFTTPAFATLGTNSQANLSGTMALWAGDVNGNNQSRYLGPNNDASALKNAIVNHSGNTTSSNYYPFTGYNNADINMNGQVRYLGPNNDSAILKNVIVNHPSNTSFSNYFPIQIAF